MEYVLRQAQPLDRAQITVSEWLADFQDRCEVAQIEDEEQIIKICKLHIGPAGKALLNSLPDGATWLQAKDALTTQLGDGTAADEAWDALQQLKRNDRPLIELGKEAERLAKKAYPTDSELTRERHAIDAFMKALGEDLATDVQRLGLRKLDDVIAAARRLEKYPTRAASSNSVMQAQLTELVQCVKNLSLATPTPATVGVAAPAVPPPPPPHYPPRSPPPYYRNGGDYRGRRGGRGRRPPRDFREGRSQVRCYLCDQPGHLVSNCPLKADLQRLHQATLGSTPAPHPPGGPPVVTHQPPRASTSSGSLNY